MIIKNRTADEVVVEGESNIKQASISRKKMGKLQYILTKALYSDPISSTIVESTNNGVDGLVKSGKDFLENPVMVEIGTRPNGSYFYRVEDKGDGMSKETFEEIVMNYLESTKEEDNDQIGSYGLGAKAFLSLDRAGTFTCRKDGREVKYLVYQGAEFCEYDLLYDKETGEGDGVLFEIDIKDRYEKAQFVQAATKKLAYYDTVVLVIDGKPIENKIYRQKDFQWSGNAGTNEMHIALKDVFYEINWGKLGLPRISIPIAIRFGLGDGLIVTPPRDSLIYDEEVRAIIKKKIEAVAEWFREKYNEEVKEFSNFVEAIPHLKRSEKFVALGDTNIEIDELDVYMSVPCKGVQVRGLKRVRDYYTHLEAMCKNFRAIGELKWNGQYKSKNIYVELQYCMVRSYRDQKAVLLDQHPVERVKDFLKEKYKKNTYFFVEQEPRLEFYVQALSLRGEKKEKWREKIKGLQELHRQIKEHFMLREKDVRGTAEFLEFVEECKRTAKANKAAGIVTSYKTIDKQEGELTIAYAREALVGNEPVFEKKAFPIEGLYKSPYISLIFNEEDKEEAKKYFGLHKNLRVAIIGIRERTKLPETHQIMEKEKFQKTKLFKRIVTALRAEDAIERWNSITREEEGLVMDCLGKKAKLKERLEAYVRDNKESLRMKNETRESFLLIAKEHSLWDGEILPDIQEMEGALETFYFLQYIDYPRYATEEDTKRVTRIINQLLLFQKKHGKLENYMLVEKPLPDEMMQEQRELEEEFLSSPEAELTLA